ncbi:reverse transcriptase domain-containing protein [Tanacetum coccineum]
MAERTMEELLRAPRAWECAYDVIKLMMFPYSLEGAAKTWYEKEPPNSILTWEDLVTKFVNQFFPPSKTTHLKNEISRFTQKFEETFSEAWERFKELLRACPHHGFTELTQVDTFYNGLNDNEQDSLNAAAGGNLLSKTTREALNIIENKSKVRYSRNKPNASRINATSSKTDERIDKLADQLSTLVTRPPELELKDLLSHSEYAFLEENDKYGYIRNHKKTIKNKQARTRERKSVQKPEAKAIKSQIYSQLHSSKRPRKAQVKPCFVLISLSEEAHICHIMDCHAGNPCVHICDPTAYNNSSMIKESNGDD